MDYNVEIMIGHSEVDRAGYDEALTRAKLTAWHKTMYETRPTRSIILRDLDIQKCEFGSLYSAYAYRLRFRFEVE